LHLPRYSEEQFLELSIKVLPKLKIGPVIGKAVWDQGSDIRDVTQLGSWYERMTPPKDIDQSTIIKHGRKQNSDNSISGTGAGSKN